MKTNIVLACGAILLLSCNVGFAGGTSQGMEFADISRFDKTVFESRYPIAPVEVVGDIERPISMQPSATSEPNRAFVPRSILNINPRRFLLHVRTPAPIVQRPPIFRLSLGGRDLDLAVVDYVPDPSPRLYHLAAVILNDEGNARFTVQSEGSTVVGTVHVGEAVYRIRTLANDPSYQLLSESIGGVDAKYMTSESDDYGIAQVEARHVQMARIADLQPRHFNTADSGRVVSVLGTSAPIGILDISRILSSEPAGENIVVDEALLVDEIEGFVDGLQALTQLQQPVSLEVEYVTIGDSEFFIRFRQVIDGVPVASSGYVRADPSTGNIRTWVGSLYPKAAIENGPVILQRDALVLATDAVAARDGTTGEVTVHEAALRYVPNSAEKLRPTWFFLLTIDSQEFSVEVDALSGQASINLRPGAYSHTTCYPNTPGTNICSPVYEESPAGEGQRLCVGPTENCDSRQRRAWDTVQEMEDYWIQHGGAENCCGQLPNGNYPSQILVILDGDGPPRYISNADMVVLPPVGTEGFLQGVDPVDPNTDDVFSHEIMHAYEEYYNEQAYNNGNMVTQSVGEGLADVNAVLHNGAIENGDWTVGDSEHQITRNLAEAKTLSDYDQSQSSQENGLVWGNMLYRLSQKEGVDLPTDLVKVQLGSWRLLSPDLAGDPAVFEIDDFEQAMLDAASGDAPLQTAISEVWNDMSGSGGGGGGGNPPAAPANIDAAFYGCDPYLYGTIWDEYWSASASATFYILYYSEWHPYGPWWYVTSTPQTSQMTEVWSDAYGKVRACNDDGCSTLSFDTNYTPHFCF